MVKESADKNEIRILIVEDETIVAKDLQNCLASLGYDASSIASSGAEAMVAAAEFQPHLVLMDIMIKGEKDGIQTASEIFDLYRIPVVYLTAYDDDETLNRAKASGAFGYILKPFEERELRVTIEMALYKHRMELRLAESSERFETTLRCIGDAVLTLDVSGRIDFINAQAEVLTGWSYEEAVGKPVEQVLVLESDDSRVILKEYVEKVLNEGGPGGLAMDAELVSKDGRRYYIDDIAAPIRDESGENHGVVLAFKDITERHLAEEREKELQEKLNRAKRMESLGILASGVAHDLNNILGPIVGYPDLLMKNLRKDNPIREDLEIIKNSARKAVTVIRDLLTLGRVGRHPSEPVNINEVVETYLKSAAYLSLSEANPEVTVETHLHPGVLPIMGSEHQLLQLLMNLVGNAFEAMSSGGYLVIGTSVKRFDNPLDAYETIKPGDYVMLHVSDTGMGIPDADKSRIFEPFYTKKKLGFHSGTGLGLAVVYGVVKDHNGFIDLKTKVNKGAQFEIYLPVAPEVSDRKKTRSIDIHGHESVLIVDDDPEQRRFAERMLQMLGYRILTAGNGKEGVDRFNEECDAGRKVDLVLLDMIMADGFDGLDTYREMLERAPGQRAIIVSGFAMTERIREALDMGVGQYIQKPYTVGDLGKAVRRELDRN